MNSRQFLGLAILRQCYPGKHDVRADLLQQKISQLLPTPPGSDSASSNDAKKHPSADRVLVEHDDKLGDGVQCVGGKKVLHVELRD